MNKASTNQQKPEAGNVSILPLVLSDLQARSDMGKRKYGTRLRSENGRSALWDAYQEVLDLCMYLRQEIEERGELMINEPYVPSNSTEGILWESEWCDKCSRRAKDPNAKTQCVYELKALIGEDNKKWFYIDGVPTCIAFRDRKLKKEYSKKHKIDKNQRQLFKKKENLYEAKQKDDKAGKKEDFQKSCGMAKA